MKNKIFISVIIPVYNESKRIQNIQIFFDYFKKQKYTSEIIIVNDGSNDNTLNLLNSLKKRLGFKLITYNKNRGKGFAIKNGVKNSLGEHILFTDIDLSTPLKEIDKFIPHFKNFDIVIGTRKNKDALLLNRQPFLREYLGKGFTLLSQIILDLKISDFTCGFKCFSRKSALGIFPLMKVNRWGFDSEVLFISKRRNYKIKEVSVIWKNDLQSKVKFPQDIIRSLKELIEIRINNSKHFYD